MSDERPPPENDDRPRVMCVRRHQTPLPGARSGMCAGCGAAIWVSYSLMPRVRSGEMVPLCPDCILPLLKEKQAEIQLHPDTLRELETVGLREYAQAAVKTFTEHPEILDAYARSTRQMPPDAGGDVHRQGTQGEGAPRRTRHRHMRRRLRRNGS